MDSSNPTGAHVLPSPLLCKYSNRVSLKTLFSHPDGGVALVGQKIVIGGWVKSSSKGKLSVETEKDSKLPQPPPRDQESRVGSGGDNVPCWKLFLQFRISNFLPKSKGNPTQKPSIADSIPQEECFTILSVSDGSCATNLRVVVDSSLAPYAKIKGTGTSILAEGTLRSELGKGDETARLELNVESILHIGSVDAETYPLSKKRIPLEHLQNFPNFRSRTRLIGCVMRLRSEVSFAVHEFLRGHGFICIQTPILTTTSAEPSVPKLYATTHRTEPANTENWLKLNEQSPIKRKTSKEAEENTESIMKGTERSKELMKPNNSKVNTQQLAKQKHLICSSRLHTEAYACSMGNVYSMGPVFQPFPARTSESWVVELSIAFSKLKNSMSCGLDLLVFLCGKIMENCADEIAVLSKRTKCRIDHRLRRVIECEFVNVDYSEAVKLLKKVSDVKFGERVVNGGALGEEHVRYLAEEIYKKPIIIFDFPKEVMPFHARLNDDQLTVSGFVIVFPEVGTLIRGVENEERYVVLDRRMNELRMEGSEYEWYLELRKHGMVRTSTLSLHLDMLLLYATALTDLRDVIPFP